MFRSMRSGMYLSIRPKWISFGQDTVCRSNSDLTNADGYSSVHTGIDALWKCKDMCDSQSDCVAVSIVALI